MEPVGEYLKREREQRQLSVAELAQTTRIPVRILRQIERDEDEGLPADVFVRGFLRAYARALDLDEEHVLARHGREAPEPAAPALPPVPAQEPGRSFGITIAVVILLILFTLALSIVLRPRHRDAPLELSQAAEREATERPTECVLAPNPPAPFFSAASTTASPIASSRS